MLCAKAPTSVIKHLQSHKVAGLYFLDIDLNCDINGVDLAGIIREYDPRGFIVFITADTSAHFLTIKRKVEPLAYIVKGSEDFEEEICDCVKEAYNRGMAETPTPLQNVIRIKISAESDLPIKLSDIFFFETEGPHFITVSYFEGEYPCLRTFRGKLSDMMKRLDSRFYRCARNCIVNMDKIVKIDRQKPEIILEKNLRVGVSESNISDLTTKLKARKPAKIAPSEKLMM